MSGTIRFDYAKAMRQVAELRSIANDMTGKCGSKLSAAISAVEKSWKGVNSQRFVGKCRMLEEQVKKEAGYIKTLANEYEKTANDIKRAEEEAARIAEAKKNNSM